MPQGPLQYPELKESGGMPEKSTDQKKALKKIADLLSRRSHSKKEIVFKLSKKFSSLVIEQALKEAQQKKWIESEKDLCEKVVESLHKKNKSWRYMKNFLFQKGLPIPPYDEDRELEKAKNLLSKKSLTLGQLSDKEKALRLRNFLFYKGFEEEILRKLSL